MEQPAYSGLTCGNCGFELYYVPPFGHHQDCLYIVLVAAGAVTPLVRRPRTSDPAAGVLDLTARRRGINERQKQWPHRLTQLLSRLCLQQ